MTDEKFAICKVKTEFGIINRVDENLCELISRSLIIDAKKENAITRQDLWDFVQEHKDKKKDEFGGWLIGEEVDRKDKQIMAVDHWNESIEKLNEIRRRRYNGS